MTAAEDGFLPLFDLLRFGAGTGIMFLGETLGAVRFKGPASLRSISLGRKGSDIPAS